MLTKRERYVLRKFRLLAQVFEHLAEDDNVCDDGQNLHDFKLACASHGFKFLGAGCFSAVVTHRWIAGRVIKWNVHNYDRTFGLMLQLLHTRHPRLLEVYHVEGNLDGYIALAEELSSNAGWDERSIKDTEGYTEACTLLARMGYTSNDTHEENIMMRGDHPDAWVFSDPANNRGDSYSG